MSPYTYIAPLVTEYIFFYGDSNVIVNVYLTICGVLL